METENEITRERADKAVDETFKWLEENYSWLVKWLTNVVTVNEQTAKVSKLPFQTFARRLERPPPVGLLETGDVIKADIIKQSIFGHVRKIITPTHPATFDGFITKLKRKPEDGDAALYTAYKWFEYQAGANGVWLYNTYKQLSR